MRTSVRRTLAAASALALTCSLAAGIRADEATDAEATKVFLQIKQCCTGYPPDYLDIGEMTGENLKWLQYDTDYDNSVTKREFLAGYAKGIAQLRPTDIEAAKLFDQLETTKDGRLSQGVEFYLDPAKAAKYRRYDLNGNGDVSLAEFLQGYAKDHTSKGQTRQTAPPPAPPAPAAAPQWQPGDAVEYEWNGNWYPATVLGTQDGQYKIRYKDWPADRFELVDASRVRPGANQPVTPAPTITNPSNGTSDNSGADRTGGTGTASTKANSSKSGPFKIGDIVEISWYTPVNGKWDESEISAGKIIGIQDAEPKYQVRMFTSGGKQRDLFQHSYRVRRPRWAVYNDYDPRLFIGSWNVGTMGGRSEQVISERDTSVGTLSTTKSEITGGGPGEMLTINADGTYIWKVTKNQTIKGRWIKSNDVDLPITLKQGYGGADWGVGPNGRARGSYNIRVKQLSKSGVKEGSQQVSGPPIGKLASIPPVLAGPERGAQNKWKPGDKVEVYDGGWYKATILQGNGKRYMVHYDGWSSSEDVEVDAILIRPRR